MAAGLMRVFTATVLYAARYVGICEPGEANFSECFSVFIERSEISAPVEASPLMHLAVATVPPSCSGHRGLGASTNIFIILFGFDTGKEGSYLPEE
jgi:hypothetical protein